MNTFIKDNELIVSLEGRLDSLTAPAFDKELQEILAAEAGADEADFLRGEGRPIAPENFRESGGAQIDLQIILSRRDATIEKAID